MRTNLHYFVIDNSRVRLDLDILNSMAEQIEDARQEGREEGERNLARELLKSGVSAERLAEAMKLSVEEVERLLQ